VSPVASGVDVCNVSVGNDGARRDVRDSPVGWGSYDGNYETRELFCGKNGIE
jgi:hypothetical protein